MKHIVCMILFLGCAVCHADDGILAAEKKAHELIFFNDECDERACEKKSVTMLSFKIFCDKNA